ncbi:protein FAM180A-like [Protopterus annectens]|uniref:protein FAM180A-like n=1 Tax=Protopterus annectens TaxID=7888 RepID=UPI001CFAD20E|nr:protein FAM180A-like [Protopterus annectens]
MANIARFLLRCFLTFALFFLAYAGARPREDSLASADEPISQRKMLLFHRSVQDADLMYELLMGGLVIEDDGTMKLQDEELASLRSAKPFISILMHVSRTPDNINQLLTKLSRTEDPMEMVDYEKVVFSTVYTALRAKMSNGPEQQQWAELCVRLANQTLIDLHRESLLYGYKKVKFLRRVTPDV